MASKNGQSAYTQHYSNAKGSVGSVLTSKGGEAVGGEGARGNSGFASKTAGGDVYAGHDGNVYKNTGSGWQKYGGNGSWNSMSKPSETAHNQAALQARPQSAERGSFGGGETQSLQNEAQNRQRGEQSSQRFEQRSGREGGGEHFGGGRRR